MCGTHVKVDHFVRELCTLIVDVSFKYRYDTLTRVAMMVTVRLDLNHEAIMDF